MEAVVDTLHKVARATVTIAADIDPDHRSCAVLGTRRFGTGCAVDDDGTVLTVNYVVMGATSATLFDIAGNSYEARRVAQDFTTGIALLRGDISRAVEPVEVGDSRGVRVGEDVFMVASADQNERRSASGAVSALDRFDAYWEYRLERAIWVTAGSPGLGGAPLCNRFGEVVGVVSLNLGAVGRATLAIPSELYREHAEELLSHGRCVSRRRRAWLGMFCHALPGRAVVAGLIPGSPAELWGLEVGDIIARIDGEPVRARSELYDRLWQHEPGDVIELDVFRDGKFVTVSVQSDDVEDFFG